MSCISASYLGTLSGFTDRRLFILPELSNSVSLPAKPGDYLFYLETAKELRKRIQRLGICYDMVVMDDWDIFLSVFGKENQVGVQRV
ncbi:hypothetical protein Holit_02370 [Hollandina sp. SP2]